MLGEQNGDPPKSQKPTHYMNIYDSTNKKSQKRLHNASSKVCTSLSGPMPGSDKSASGTSCTCHHSRTGTTIRVAGTEEHLTRPDSGNTSEPPEQVNRPHDQPELKK